MLLVVGDAIGGDNCVGGVESAVGDDGCAETGTCGFTSTYPPSATAGESSLSRRLRSTGEVKRSGSSVARRIHPASKSENCTFVEVTTFLVECRLCIHFVRERIHTQRARQAEQLVRACQGELVP